MTALRTAQLEKSTLSRRFSVVVQASVPSRLASPSPRPPPTPPPTPGNKCIAQYDVRSPHTTRLPRYVHIFSSPEPNAHWWAYSIGRHPSSVVRLSTFSNIFSSEATGPIEAKFCVEALWVRGTKVPSNGHGNMTKIAPMPIYGKNLKKSSSPEPKDRWPWNLVSSIGY